MKIVVLGGTGLIGTKVAALLAEDPGIEVVAASRATGVNSYTADGLADALDGADVLVDVTNSDYTDEAGALQFFEGSTLNLIAHGRNAGVSHHVVLSIVGVDRLSRSEAGYFRAKWIQEQLVMESGRPYTIVHATQFFEFLRSIADAATRGRHVTVAEAMIQPMAADDVAKAVRATALRSPANGIVEFAGPQRGRLVDFVRYDLAASLDPREAEADPLTRYFGELPSEDLFMPGEMATLSRTTIERWLHESGRLPEHRWLDEPQRGVVS